MKKIVCAFIISAPVMAGPVISSDCEVGKFLESPQNSGGYYFDSSCKRVFVLPPMHGKMEVSGRTLGDLGRCTEVKDFNKSISLINKNINLAIKDRASDEELKKNLDQRKLLLDEYSDLSETLGASVELSFSSEIERNVQDFRELNQNLGLEFVSVTLKDAKIYFNDKEQVDPSAKISFNRVIPLDTTNTAGAGSFSGRLDLSLFGACPLVDPLTRSIPEKLKSRHVRGLITPNLVYKFQTNATFKYVATYNLSTLAKKIKEVSTKGGLFKTSSTSRLMQTAESDGWFTLNMDCDDQRVCDVAKEETALQIKNRLIERVLNNISLTTMGTVVMPEDATAPGENGASVASRGLKKCAHAYCQAAAVVLDVGSAVFGGSSKTDSFISKNTHGEKEEVTIKKPVEITGIMGFGK